MNDIIILALSGSGVQGGAETYVIRMITWLKENSYRVILMHRVNEYFHQNVEKLIDELEVERLILPELKSNKHLPDFTKVEFKFPENSNVRIICFQSPFNFFAAEMIKHRAKNCIVQTFHYMIHQDDFCRNKTQKTSNKALQTILKSFYRRILKKMDARANTLYLVEDYARSIHENYNLPLIYNELVFVRLGIITKKIDLDKACLRYHKKPFTILTMARFDFPEKAYLIGLIDEFEYLYNKYEGIKLGIIGSGESEQLIRNKIDEKSAEVKNAIDLIGTVAYDSLDTYFNSANIYIGIATSLLDASNFGLLPITAAVNNYECKSSGFFYENPFDVIGFSGQTPARNVLEKVINMSEKEYLEASKINNDTFCEIYDMNVIMEQLLTIKNAKSKPTLSKFMLYLIKYARHAIDKLLMRRAV